jgi:hypothetical protein
MSEQYPYAPDLDELLAIGDAFVLRLAGLKWKRGHWLPEGAVFATWAEPEDIAIFPSVAFLGAEGTYDASEMVPGPIESTRQPLDGSGYVLWQDAEFVVEAQVLVWANDPETRSILVRAVREALQDNDNETCHYGTLLDCPRYFGGWSKVRVSPQAVRYEDNEVDSERRHLKAYLRVTCRLPVLRMEATGEPLETRIRLTTVGVDPLAAP